MLTAAENMKVEILHGTVSHGYLFLSINIDQLHHV